MLLSVLTCYSSIMNMTQARVQQLHGDMLSKSDKYKQNNYDSDTVLARL